MGPMTAMGYTGKVSISGAIVGVMVKVVYGTVYTVDR